MDWGEPSIEVDIQGAIVGGHVLVNWTHTSKSACCFVDALRCVPAADQNMAAYDHSL